MVRADASEGIYNDCTNVVIYKTASSGVKERVGVYCWLNSGDSYTDVVSNGHSTATLNIDRPTVVAFFAPPTESQSAKEAADSNEALADFRFYGTAVRKRFEQAGVDYKEVYASSFQVRGGGTVSTVRPAKDVGYYFAAPGKKPHITYGVLSDADLLRQVKKYFGIVTR